MITLDQARIDAPEFPRSPEWWAMFLPDWITAVDTVTAGSSCSTLPA